MSTEKMREGFEAWVKSKWPETDLGRFNDGEYCGFTLQHCWTAWQESRAAVAVELPAAPGIKPGRETYTQLQAAQHQGQMQVIRAIEAAGLKVRP